MPKVSEFSNILTLIEYSAAFIVYAISLQFIIRILYELFKHRSKGFILRENNGISNLLIASLICWTILMATALPHIAWMLFHWRPEGRQINPNSVFWTTITTECMMPVIPYSIFFLTLDRIFSVQLLNGYKERNKIMLLFACVLTILAVFFINFYAFLRILPLPAETDCNVFACLMKNGNITFISTKLFGGVMIIIFGAYFFYCLRKRAKSINVNIQSNIARNQLNKVEPDTLVKLMLCTEIGLNFAPQLTIFIIQLIIEHQIASIIGPINHFLNCFDALISVLTYRHTLRRFIGIDITVTTQSHVNLHQVINYQV
uniref:G_PROTEIN_RECEP_F1_2 domain-containing protein n=1 Tax=Meloidogyne incognita TaxID=6306 RepID=A0A914KZJ5_MELIC